MDYTWHIIGVSVKFKVQNKHDVKKDYIFFYFLTSGMSDQSLHMNVLLNV